MNNEVNNNVVIGLRILYPLWVLFGIFSIMYIPSTILDFSDAMKTVENLEQNGILYRLGIVGRLITQILFLLIPFLLYLLFQHFNKAVALLMLLLAVISIPISIHNEIQHLILLDSLGDPASVMALLDSYNHGMNITTIFWGLWLFPLGWLTHNSNFFPRIIGICLYIGGLGYLIGAFMRILFPEVDQLSDILEIMTFGEMIFIIWFVARGIKK